MNDDLGDLLAFLQSRPARPDQTLAQRRADFDRAETAMPLPDGIGAAPWSHGTLRGQWLSGGRDAERALGILYLHGGGFQYGSSRSHRHLAAAIAGAAAGDALALDYRLAPEHPFPAGLEDALAAYAFLIDRHGPGRVAVAGDSAGAGLAVAMLAAARARGLAMPGGLVCLSPWIDLTCPAPTAAERQRIADPIVQGEIMAAYVAAYLGPTAATDPLATPTRGSLAGLPATLIQVGGGEYLLRDALALTQALADARVPVALEIEPNLPHVWQWFWPRLARGREAIARIGQFLRQRLG